MSRLVVVSNRVSDISKAVQSGGLAVALQSALRNSNGLWFGWDGKIVDNLSGNGLSETASGNIRIVTTPLTEYEYNNYYLGFSNKVLWPSLHNRLDLANFEPSFIEGYRKTNHRFALALSRLLEPDDLIWVHDYHLFPLATELRAQQVSQRIGFFLHIPIPPPEIFVAIPDYEWLMRSLFSYDVVGFQTNNDVENFIRCVLSEADGENLGGGRVRAYGRTILVRAFPIGIDVDQFYEMAHTPDAEKQIERLERRSVSSTHIVGVDRLDYTKGLPDRLKAFRRLLELYPENRKAVTLMQIAPPTREEVQAYADIREELEKLSGSINGEFGDFDWTPVRYIHRAVPRATLAALFRGSRVGFVTPLRDGMNLVAKEYIAAQDADNPGVLVLSRFAGAAEDLEEAIIINPYDTDEMANGLQIALTMRLQERRERHSALLDRIRRNDVNAWSSAFLAALSDSEAGQDLAAPGRP